MFEKLKQLGAKCVEHVKGMTPSQRFYAVLGVGVVGVGFYIGGVVLQAVFAGLVFNALLWAMIRESEWLMDQMAKWGWHIDLLVTVAGIIFGLTSPVTGMMTGIVVGAIFSVFRVTICGARDTSDNNKGSAEQAEPAAA